MYAHMWPTFCIYRFFILYTKKGVLGGPKHVHRKFLAFVGHFGHQNRLFFKAITLLRPFFKTRGHDGTAHTFGSCQRFLEVPQKGV